MIQVTLHSIADKAAQSQIAGMVDLVLQRGGYRQSAIDAQQDARITVKFEKEPRR
ncbi:hypothetical protein [Sphingopyxis sp. GW247-27LB]|uniref:hypothetical protein n=1 Tax=Sphingopyxis sp. GW247-27LB TaxID=2012632 RepID=UPI001595428E|nr:hypothetical protein [Sphingopyxis sp. GW247-27LB]